jgi:hypothetical protein
VVVSTAAGYYSYTPANGDSVRCVITTSGGVCSGSVVAYSNTVNMSTIGGLPAIGGGPAVCMGGTLSLTDAVAGGIWSSSNSAVAAVSAGVVTGNSLGTATITYALGAGCITSKIISVQPPPNAGTITDNSVNAFCIGNTFTVKDTAAGGVWSISNSNATLSGNVVTAVSAGWDTIYYTVSNACGMADDSISFFVSPPPPPVSGNLRVCLGDTTILADALFGGMWRGGPNISITTNMMDSAFVAGLAVGTAIITYSMDLGCTTYATLTVEPVPDAGIISGPSGICPGASFLLSVSAAGGIWRIGNTKVATIDTTGMIHTLALGQR